MEPLLANVNMDGGQSQMSVTDMTRGYTLHDQSSLSTFDHNIDTGVSDPILCGLNATQGSSVLLLPIDSAHLMPEITLFSPTKDRCSEAPILQTFCFSTINTATTNTTELVTSRMPSDAAMLPKKRSKRNKNAPRLPTSGYLLYCRSERAALMQEHANMTNAEVTKILGAQWSRMHSNDKQKYMLLAEQDKQRYIDELDTYKTSKGYTPTEADDLYCADCDKYFVSMHNKTEHMVSSNHRRQIIKKQNTFLPKVGKRKCSCLEQQQSTSSSSAFKDDIETLANVVVDMHATQQVELNILRETSMHLDQQNEKMDGNLELLQKDYDGLLEEKNKIEDDTKSANIYLTRLLILHKIFEESI